MVCVVVEGLLDRAHFRDVACRGGGRVSVHVAHLLRIHPGVLQCLLDASANSETISPGLRHVVRVAGPSAPKVLGEDPCAARLGVREALHDEDPGALTQDEAVAFLVPWARCGLRALIPSRQRPAGDETAEAELVDWGLNATCQDEIALTAADVVCRRDHAEVGRGAGGGNGVVHRHEPCLDCQHAAAHVCDAVRDEERADLLRPSLFESRRALLDGINAAHARPNQNAAHCLVQGVEGVGADLDASICQCLLPRDQGILQKRIEPSCLLGRDVFATVIVRDLASKARRPTLGVEAFDRLDPGLSRAELLVEMLIVLAEDRGQAHASDDNAVLICRPLGAHACPLCGDPVLRATVAPPPSQS
mmetsp:Transcript_64374/g.104135  ORF Transcript_64374/g.104135 Transcript_64374/m.104135 type:complete len:362 (+) Transcript_64374:346-1431(+)